VSVTFSMSGGDLTGLKWLRERMKDANKAVLVGVPVGAGDEKDGTPLAVVAAVHEFGYPEGRIPERSFLRTGVREGANKFKSMNEANLRAVVQGTKTVDQSMDMLGLAAAAEVQRKIRRGPFEELKPATIAARKRQFGKTSSKPLIASGDLIQSITYVREGEQSANARIIE